MTTRTKERKRSLRRKYIGRSLISARPMPCKSSKFRFDLARTTKFAGPKVVWGFRKTISAHFYLKRKATHPRETSYIAWIQVFKVNMAG